LNVKRIALTGLFLIALAGSLRAEEIDWTAPWVDDSGAARRLDSKDGKTLSFVAAVPFGGQDLAVPVAGVAKGSSVSLDGTFAETRGIVGVVEGKKETDATHSVSVRADATTDGAGLVANVSVVLDGQVARRETWRRATSTLEIVALTVDGAPLGGTFDPKLSKDGLTVWFQVTGKALDVTCEIVVAPGHPYASFYADLARGGRTVIRGQHVGFLAPGTYQVTWDGRDETAAKRIALGGPYTVKVSGGVSDSTPDSDGLAAGPVSTRTKGAPHDEKNLTVAQPRFEFLGSDWAPDAFDTKQDRWDTSGEPIALGASLAYFNGDATQKGFLVENTTTCGTAAEARQRLAIASFAILSSHGANHPPLITFYRGSGATPYAGENVSYLHASDLGGGLKDLHFAIFDSCHSGDPSSVDGGPSLCRSLCNAGCDIAIGFAPTPTIAELPTWHREALGMLAKGTPIEKAARDAARISFKVRYPGKATLTGRGLDLAIAEDRARAGDAKSIAASMVVERAPGIPSDESLWPPRYGNSTN
jgi:hypothetical protein